jgi:hypothetical protein
MFWLQVDTDGTERHCDHFTRGMRHQVWAVWEIDPTTMTRTNVYWGKRHKIRRLVA